MSKLINFLSQKDIEKYSKLFHQPVSVVKLLATIYDDIKEFEQNLYEIGEEHLPEDNIVENEDDDDIEEEEEFIANKIQQILPLIKETIAKKMGIDPENIDDSIKMIKMNPNVLNHMCPFTKEQQKNIDCSFCPLHIQNFIPIAMNISKYENISFEEAAETIKLHTYRDYQETYEKIIHEMKKYKEDAND